MRSRRALSNSLTERLAVLRDIYAQAGVELALHKVTFYQVLEQSVQGEYLIG